MNVMDENLFIHHFRKKVYEIYLDISLDISHLNFHLIRLWEKMLTFVHQIVSPDYLCYYCFFFNFLFHVFIRNMVVML